MQAYLSQSSVSSPAQLPTKTRRYIGRSLGALAALFLTFDGAMKVVKIQPVIDGMQRAGFSEATARPLGLVLLASVALYVTPRTAILGAVLLTGYLGGAVATHVRALDPLFSHALFPAYFGVLIWTSLYLRDPRLAAFAPWKKR